MLTHKHINQVLSLIKKKIWIFLWSLSVLLLLRLIKKYIILVYLGFLLLCFCFYLLSCIFISSFRINWYNYGICKGETGW